METLFRRARSGALPAAECWELLHTEIAPDLAQREELLASGVAPHTARALYPDDFDSFAAKVLTELNSTALWSLNSPSITPHQWGRVSAVSHRLHTSLGRAQDDFLSEWSAFDEGPLWNALQSLLSRSQGSSRAADCAFSYIRTLHGVHRAAANPSLLTLPSKLSRDADECACWAVNYLLPARLN